MDPSLPTELLAHICSFLASCTADLAAAARVSAAWCAAAQPLLYARVAVRNDPGPLPTLASSPRLARVVRSFAVSVPHALVPAALPNMALLQELDLFLDALPDALAFPALQRFATSLPWSAPLLRFLHACPSLDQLYLDSPAPVPDLPLPPAFLPALAHFTGPSALALRLVPHRPVQHIDLTATPHSLGLTPSLAHSLALSSAPVLALAATTAEDESLLGVLKILAVCMPHLTHLRVVTNTYADASSSDLFDNIHQMADTLTSLPDLQSCEIWGFHWVSSIKNDISYSPTTWQTPSFSNTTTPNYYQDLIFPY